MYYVFGKIITIPCIDVIDVVFDNDEDEIYYSSDDIELNKLDNYHDCY